MKSRFPGLPPHLIETRQASVETISTDKGDRGAVVSGKSGQDCIKWRWKAKCRLIGVAGRRSCAVGGRGKKGRVGGNCVRKEVASRPRQGRSKGQWPSEKRGRCIQVMHIRFHIITLTF